MKHLHTDMDWTLFEFIEGNLDPAETQYVQSLIQSDPKWTLAYSRWKTSFLQPETVHYPKKELLYRKKSVFLSYRSRYIAAASVLLVLWGAYTIWQPSIPIVAQESSLPNTLNKQHSIISESQNSLKRKDDKPAFKAKISGEIQHASASINNSGREKSSKKRETRRTAIADTFMPKTLVKKAEYPKAAHTQSLQVAGIEIQSKPEVHATKAYISNAAFFQFIEESLDPSRSTSHQPEIKEPMAIQNLKNLQQRLSYQAYSKAKIQNETASFSNKPQDSVDHWSRIWTETKKGRLPNIRIALQEQEERLLPIMNIYLTYTTNY